MAKALALAALLFSIIPSAMAAGPVMLVTYGVSTVFHNSVFPTSLNGSHFPDVSIPGTRTYAYLIRNIGDADLTISKAGTALTGADADEFAFQYALGFETIPPGGSLGMSLTFLPGAEGARTATLTIPTNGTNVTGTYIVNLLGVGVLGAAPLPDLKVELPAGVSTDTSYTKTGRRRLVVRGTISPQTETDATEVHVVINETYLGIAAIDNQLGFKRISRIKGMKNGVAKPKKFKVTCDVPHNITSDHFAVRVFLLADPEDRAMADNGAFIPLTKVVK